MRRVISLWLPRFPTDRLAQEKARIARLGSSSGRTKRTGLPAPRTAEEPFATVAREAGGLRLAALNSAAEAAGLVPGMPLADARALCPYLALAPAQPLEDARRLAELADWGVRYSPYVALDGADGLLLDVTGAALLFGGEEALLADLVRRVERLGFAARAALADTPGAAFALARYGAARALIAPAGESEAALRPLPVLSLRLAPESVADLERLGLSSVGALLDRPRAALAARFGEDILRRLDEAVGRRGAPLNPRLPVPLQAARLAFAEPISTPQSIAAATRRLFDELCTGLKRDGLGARRLALALYRVDGRRASTTIATSRALDDADHLFKLFADKLEALDPGFGVETMTLSALAVEPIKPAQLGLRLDATASPSEDEAALARLLDRLENRLGEGRVRALAVQDSHIPERAQRLVPPSAGRPGAAPPSPEARRPLALLFPPEPIEAVAETPDAPPVLFRRGRAVYRVLGAEGPERIAPEWWRGGPEAVFRDYYLVEDVHGRRFWLYRDGPYRADRPARWFLHGVFG